ncbi:ATP-binding protein [Streptomyces canus]|uniref:histidine kinase n=1 Tax=Streptomyces canus TaxID=58343 RepID=A0AAW8F8I1_9ACTN|nr:ATP-binding protein [Streptomyces canus]MDQ0906162.1 signal transduction histidine kinase [Streptomyces canus]MDQ1066108.1 signal transduction histidine kinase [Streptomyces canus]
MSHLRAPAARADRREGGRHGRPVARPAPSLSETHIRPQLLRLAVLPPIAVALSGCAAVLFTVRSTGAQPSLILWGVLGGAVSVTLAAILIAAVAADRAAKTVSDRVGALRRSSARREADLRVLVEGLRRGEIPPGRGPSSGPPDDADDFELLAADLARAHDGAVTAVVQAAQLSSQAGSEQKLEVFVNLARRLQSLVHREISILDELENEIEDPDLLKGLFHVDHLATRIRRHAENLAVLGGAVSRRQWSNPVSMTEVLRSAIAEVEQYSRVKLVPPIDGTLRGHAVADVIHLLAELVENATVFSAPHTQVLLRANLVTSGLAVEVEDRGLGMPVTEQHRMNALLADPDQVNVASLLADGRIGLFVVSQLAKRHGIHVRLQTNIYGGVQAVLVVPQALLGSAPAAIGAQSPETAGTTVSAQRPAHPRPGHEARHRGAPAEPRPGVDPRRGELRGTESGLNGSAAPTTKSGGAVPQGARVVRNGSGPVRNGSGRPPSDGDRASSGGGPMADGAGSLTHGGGGVPADEGAAPDAGLDGGGAASSGGRSGPGGSDPLASGGGSFLNGGSEAPSGGGSVPSAGGRLSGGGFSPDGGGDVSDARGQVPGGIDFPSSGGGSFLDGGSGVPGGGGRVPGGSDSSASGGGSFLGGGSEAPAGGEAWSGGSGSLDGGVTGRKPGGGNGSKGGGAHSGRPAPLPVRGARAERPTPAEAVPGIKPDDRRLVAEHVTAPPTPRTGTVRGTMGKPQLPRRRAQEHIAPQLRGGPTPRQDPEYPAGHDPGLMAAFQRGISLAEAQQHLEPAPGESTTTLPSPRMGADPMDPAHTVSAHMDPTPMTSPPVSSTPKSPAPMDSLHMDAAHMGSAQPDRATTGRAHTDTSYTDAAHTDTGSAASAPLEPRPSPPPAPSASFDFGFDLDASHTDAAPMTGAAPIDVTPMERPHISEAHGLDLDRTTPRHDGSAPAG